MKLTFLGNFRVEYCSEVHYKKTLEAMGHEVVALQESEASADTVLRHALTSDAFIWVHTHGWDTPGIIYALNTLREKGIPSIGYHLDLYMGIARWKEYEDGDYFKVEHFFTVDKNMADWLNENTETKGHYLYAGVFGQECYLPEQLPAPEYDVIFVGSRNYHKEWPYRPQLVDWLKATYGDRFAHFGNDGKGVVRGHPLNLLYQKTKVVVGDTLCPGFNYPEYWSDRIFETTGRGGFIIHPQIQGLENCFEIGKEIVTYEYNDFDSLREKIDYYLTNDAEREAIRRAGWRRTKDNHTYTHRWQTILETVKNG